MMSMLCVVVVVVVVVDIQRRFFGVRRTHLIGFCHDLIITGRDSTKRRCFGGRW